MREMIERVLAEHPDMYWDSGARLLPEQTPDPGSYVCTGCRTVLGDRYEDRWDAIVAHQAEMIAAHFEQVGDIRMMLGDPLGKPVPVWRLRPED